MLRKILSSRGVIPVVMCLQVVPLLILPPSSYTGKSQEWWLPALLTFLVIIALVQILVRKTRAPWPWYLVSFAQGVNIISRLMMLMPHATRNNSGVQEFNTVYVIVALAAMVLSAFEIWYNDLPEVRRKIFSA
jgi:4-amino-4-deoxy-L-arabinose transferase-like glycosyltransferase